MVYVYSFDSSKNTIANQSLDQLNLSVFRHVRLSIPSRLSILRAGKLNYVIVFLAFLTSPFREIWTFKGRLEKPYLRATAVGSYAKFNIVVGVMHRVRITYLRSKTFGLGDVWCWLDDNRDGGKRIESWWNLDNMCEIFQSP